MQEELNTYLVGENHCWANCQTGLEWYDYSFRSKVNIRQGTMHVNFRMNDRGRYFMGISEDWIYLTRDNDWGTYTDLGSAEVSLEQEVWLWLEIIANQKAIQVLLNNELILQIWDKDALLTGSIAFETLEDSKFYIDSVIVNGAPQPDPPDGYDWIRTGGPPGGLGYDIRIHQDKPDIVVVTDNPSGINKSYDGGKTWHQRNNGISVRTGSSNEEIPVFSVTMDPGNQDVIWCGTQNSRGIFKSTDCGESWTRMDQGITENEEISFRGFAIHPMNPNVVLAASEISTEYQGIEFNRTKGKIYKTVDGGLNWYPVWEGENLARVLLFDYLHPDTVFCSTGIFDREAFNSNPDTQVPGGVGILRSYDGGETWNQVNQGIDNLYTGYLEMHPEDPQILFAASGNHAYHDHSGKIYKTTNGGDSWKTVLNGSSFSVVTISKYNPSIVYAFNEEYCYRSQDGGENWTQYYKPEEGVWGPPGIKPGIPISAAVDPRDMNRVFVNNYNGGNFLTTNGGKTWSNSSNGYTGADIRDLRVDPDRPFVVYAAGRTGVFKTVNGGKEWFGISNGPVWTELLSICTAGQQFNTIYGLPDGSLEILSSVDGGNQWEVVYKHDSINLKGSGFHTFSDIEGAPSDPHVIYAGMDHILNIGNFDPDGIPSYGMYRSTNSGKSWEQINNGLGSSSRIINTIAVHPDSSEVVYIGTYSDGIYKTTNGGNSWEAVNNGLASSDIRSIAIDPSDPNIVYAGSGNGYGIYKSIDGGTLWTECNYGFQLNCPSYLSSFGRGVEGMDLDGMGQTFISADYYNVSWTKILDIAIDPIQTDHIYAADFSSGIHFSPDGGKSWSTINSGVTLRVATCLDISSDGAVLYAGIKGNGVLRMTLKNLPPGIQRTIPDHADTVVIYQGDSLQFELLCFDLNNDTLSYQWNFDQRDLQTDYDATYILKTAGEVPGTYPLTAIVSDNDTSVIVNWIVEIRERESTSIEILEEMGSDEMITICPNPLIENVEIRYWLPFPAIVSMDLFDIPGRLVANLYQGTQMEGWNRLFWDGSSTRLGILPNGIYILKITYKGQEEIMVQERKLVISR
jgi:photosystem II stability/assembly factor-like uncharacterized protein